MGFIELEDLHKSYGATEVIHGFSLSIDEGERIVFVGPSGCGKSTLLRMMCGIEELTAGRIAVAGRDVSRLSPARRGFAMVFQNYALYPHMTVARNIGFSMRMAGRPRGEIAARVSQVCALLRLKELAGRYPAELSGGQRQRVAIGRALVRDPVAFLFDEPLSNLDAALRLEMRLEIGKLQAELGHTMIYVTHDQSEAMTLADRIVVLNQGRIEQTGTPRQLYETPANEFVAAFIGMPRICLLEANDFLPGHDAFSGETVRLGLRPEAVRIDPDGPIPAALQSVEYLGAESFGHFLTAAGRRISVRLEAGLVPGGGGAHRLGFPPASALRFNAAGERIPRKP